MTDQLRKKELYELISTHEIEDTERGGMVSMLHVVRWEDIDTLADAILKRFCVCDEHSFTGLNITKGITHWFDHCQRCGQLAPKKEGEM